MDLDFDFDFFDFDLGRGLDLPFDNDFGADSFFLPIVFIGSVTIASAFALVNLLVWNLGFLFGAIFLVSIIFMLPNRIAKKNRFSRETRHVIFAFLFLGVVLSGYWGTTIYQKRAEEARIQAEIEAEKQAAIDAENEKIGMSGRLKRWWFGTGTGEVK